MKSKHKFIFCSLVFLVYFLLFILKPIYQYISFSKMDVNSSMVQWIQDKNDQDWHALDKHIHLVPSKENGKNIGLIYVVDDYNQIESKISSENQAVSISYNNRFQGDKSVEISWLNGEKWLYHAGRYLKLAGENQAVIESNTGSSVTVWEQRSEEAKKRLYAVVEQMKQTVLEHLLQQIVLRSLAVILFLLGWRIYGAFRKRGDSPSLM
uniref:hypothetical protein n=1 Tax=uncultured Streptococcus sp. TaxID=83427 RepID=UPI0025DDAB06|nr:hypothetical protein [uncultured Streptococcus sp.]